MLWRLIVLVLSIFVIIILLQQLDDINALQSPIFIRSSQFFSENPLMVYLVELGNELICISKMAVMALLLYYPIVTALVIIFLWWKVQTVIFAMQM